MKNSTHKWKDRLSHEISITQCFATSQTICSLATAAKKNHDPVVLFKFFFIGKVSAIWSQWMEKGEIDEECFPDTEIIMQSCKCVRWYEKL